MGYYRPNTNAFMVILENLVLCEKLFLLLSKFVFKQIMSCYDGKNK